MEINEEKILRSIDEDVSSNAELVRKQVEEETRALHEDQIAFYRESLKKETETYLEKELSELRTYAAMKSSRDKMDTKKKLLHLRSALADELFALVKEDLKAFVASNGYRSYLEKEVDKLDVLASGVFACRKDDMAMLQDILKARGYNNAIEVAYLHLGGFLYRDEEQRMQYSCSLDEKLEEEKSWFRTHSDFRVTESEDKR